MTAPAVTGCGWIVWDDVLVVPAYPAENTKTEATLSFEQVGGPVPRAMAALAGLGLRTRLVAAVGGDAYGQRALEMLADLAVGIDSVEVINGSRTPRASVWLSSVQGSRTIAYESHGTAEPVRSAAHDSLGKTSWLHLDGRHAGVAIELARAAESHDVRVSVDLGSAKPSLVELVPLCDLVVGPRRTWRFLATEAGLGSELDLIARLRSDTSCVITEGERLCEVWDGLAHVVVRPRSARTVDSNGAGDVFAAFLIWAMLSSLDAKTMLSTASAAAALKCEEFGYASIPTVDDLDRLEERRTTFEIEEVGD